MDEPRTNMPIFSSTELSEDDVMCYFCANCGAAVSHPNKEKYVCECGCEMEVGETITSSDNTYVYEYHYKANMMVE